MEMKFPFIVGYATLKSNLTIEEVGKILSEKLFGGAQFGGKEKEIHEEVPAIFISDSILGLRIILEGYTGIEPETNFTLVITPWITPKDMTYENIRLDNYLTQLLKIQLKDRDDILVVE